MTLDEFHKTVNDLMPFRETKDPKGRPMDFKSRLRTSLYKYKEVAEHFVCVEVFAEISDIIKRLIDIVNQYEKGLQASAYNKFQLLIQGKKDTPPLIDLTKTILSFNRKKPITFYRIRLMESIYGVEPREMFHIPINQRGMVKTQRYSMPGYPCLYLGESIYGCWEEMCRPTMQKCAIARLEYSGELKIVDLARPKKESLKNPDWQRLIPLIISCMIPVTNSDATYKPEYIIPQLIMQWVLKSRSRGIDGVCYTSTHINNEFFFPEDKFINFAIPVYKVDGRNKYCPKLCEHFNITCPTTNDIEKLKHSYPINGGGAGVTYPQEIREENYNCSDFSNLEKRLNNVRKFPLHHISPK